MKALMDSLGDLAGHDMVLLREAGFDREAEPIRGAPKAGAGWIGALRRAALVFRDAAPIAPGSAAAHPRPKR